jgi:hypothetical protein
MGGEALIHLAQSEHRALTPSEQERALEMYSGAYRVQPSQHTGLLYANLLRYLGRMADAVGVYERVCGVQWTGDDRTPFNQPGPGPLKCSR